MTANISNNGSVGGCVSSFCTRNKCIALSALTLTVSAVAVALLLTGVATGVLVPVAIGVAGGSALIALISAIAAFVLHRTKSKIVIPKLEDDTTEVTLEVGISVRGFADSKLQFTQVFKKRFNTQMNGYTQGNKAVVDKILTSYKGRHFEALASGSTLKYVVKNNSDPTYNIVSYSNHLVKIDENHQIVIDGIETGQFNNRRNSPYGPIVVRVSENSDSTKLRVEINAHPHETGFDYSDINFQLES